MSSNAAHMREYMKRRYHERRAMALKTLGGRCCRCGSTRKLEIDHRDPTTKTMSFKVMFGCGLPRFMKELALCQLLCQRCHTKKTVVEDLGRQMATHGALSMYRNGCRCDPCRSAKSKANRRYKKRKRDVSIRGDALAS